MTALADHGLRFAHASCCRRSGSDVPRRDHHGGAICIACGAAQRRVTCDQQGAGLSRMVRSLWSLSSGWPGLTVGVKFGRSIRLRLWRTLFRNCFRGRQAGFRGVLRPDDRHEPVPGSLPRLGLTQLAFRRRRTALQWHLPAASGRPAPDCQSRTRRRTPHWWSALSVVRSRRRPGKGPGASRSVPPFSDACDGFGTPRGDNLAGCEARSGTGPRLILRGWVRQLSGYRDAMLPAMKPTIAAPIALLFPLLRELPDEDVPPTGAV